MYKNSKFYMERKLNKKNELFDIFKKKGYNLNQ